MHSFPYASFTYFHFGTNVICGKSVCHDLHSSHIRCVMSQGHNLHEKVKVILNLLVIFFFWHKRPYLAQIFLLVRQCVL